MTRWMDVARRYEGLAEVEGPRSNPVILGWLQHEGGGASWVTDDATPWCGATMAGVFTECGLSEIVPPQPLAAKSWADVGVALPGPKRGALIVRPRTGGAHVGLVEKWDETHVWIRGGNQNDQFNVARFPRTPRDVYRWPVPLKSPREVEAEGSRIARAARRQQRDTAAAGGLSVSPVAVPPPAPPLPPVGASGPASVTPAAMPPSPPPALPDVPSVTDQVQALPDQIGALKSVGVAITDFAAYLGVAWPVVALALGCYFAARVAWDGYLIRQYRTQDANEGW